MEASPENQEIKISDLSQTPSWKRSINFYKYQQFWYYDYAVRGIILFQKNFIPKPSDVFLCTTPKSGTTWLKALCISIQTRAQYLNGDSDSDSPLLSKNPHDIVPCLELLYGLGGHRDPRIPLLHTHVPFSSLPESVLNSNCKIIYMCRDPKDVLISHYLFTSKQGDGEIIPFKEVYEMFCNGISNSGPFWDHVLGYWKASLEYPERILFLKYEGLKSDTCFHVKKIADFMGCGFSEGELKDEVVENIVEMCSFEKLSNLEANKSINTYKGNDGTEYKFEKGAYFRKGEVGDWKNYLSTEMAERIGQITYKKFEGSGLQM